MAILFFNMSLLYGQKNVRSEPKVKNGEFYFYAKNSTDRFFIVRKDSSQEEINLNENDTSFGELVDKMIHPFMSNFCDALKKYRTRSFLFIKLT